MYIGIQFFLLPDAAVFDNAFGLEMALLFPINRLPAIASWRVRKYATVRNV